MTVVEPETPACVAVMVALPTATPVTTPVGSTVAGPVEVQLNKGAARGCMLPSENVPVAVSCTLVPLAMDGFGGVTVIDVRTAAVTVTVVEPVTPACVAVTVPLPSLAPVTKPVGLTVAEPVEVQLNNGVVRICVVPSESVPVAVSC